MTSTNKVQNYGQYDGDYNAGNDGEDKYRITMFYNNITGKFKQMNFGKD
jgi:hypothetical protein